MSKNSLLLKGFIVNWFNKSLDSNCLGRLSVNNNDCLCLNNFAELPFARLERDNKTIILHFHTKYAKQIIGLLELKQELIGIIENWIFVHTLYPEKNNHDEYDNHFDNMYNIIETYLLKPFFKYFSNNDFDLIEILESYMQKFDCTDVFDDICYYRLNKIINRKIYCHRTMSSKPVFNDEMKSKLNNLGRRVHINRILKDL